ncbi:hypothetical protein [Bariatricus sp. SGI.019]|uniref:hypothetical protein n=1 Tax=Bariatricus sp. SGI.019 TaxID=3420548 RepID=UPI003D0272E5
MNEFEYIGEWVEVKCANDGSKFIVDRSCWDSYLKDYKWISCTNKYGQISIQTAVNKVTKLIHQMIYEREYPKWMWHGAIIDHISDSYYGNKRRDNRKCNLRVVESNSINANNIKSTNNMIHESKSGYQVTCTCMGEKKYKFFGIKNYGSKEDALKAAELYRDNVVIPWKNEQVKNEEKELNESMLKRMIHNAISNGDIDMITNFVNEAKLIYT